MDGLNALFGPGLCFLERCLVPFRGGGCVIFPCKIFPDFVHDPELLVSGHVLQVQCHAGDARRTGVARQWGDPGGIGDVFAEVILGLHPLLARG